MVDYLKYGEALAEGGEAADKATADRAASRAKAMEAVQELRRKKQEKDWTYQVQKWWEGQTKPASTETVDVAAAVAEEKPPENPVIENATKAGAVITEQAAAIKQQLDDRQNKVNEDAVKIMSERSKIPGFANTEIGRAFMVGQATDRLGQLGHKAMNYALSDKKIAKEDGKEIKDLMKVLAYKSKDEGWSTWLNSASKLIGQQYETATDPVHNPYVTGLTAATVAAGAGAVTGGVGAVPAAAAGEAATLAAIANRSAIVEGGHAFLDFFQMKHGDGKQVTAKEAAFAAKAVGGINGALETVGFSKAAAMIPGLNKFIGGKAIASNPTIRTAIMGWAKKYAKGVGTEAFTEGLQELPGIVMGAMLQDKDVVGALADPKTAEQVLGVMQETAKGMAVLGAPGTGKGVYSDVKNVRAQRREEIFNKSLENLMPAEEKPAATPNAPEETPAAPEQGQAENLPKAEFPPMEPTPKEKAPKKPKVESKEKAATTVVTPLEKPPVAPPGESEEVVNIVPQTEKTSQVDVKIDPKNTPAMVAEDAEGNVSPPIPAPEGIAPTIKVTLMGEEEDAGYPTILRESGVRKAMPKRVWTVNSPTPIKLGWLTRPAILTNDNEIYEGPQVPALTNIEEANVATLDALVESRSKAEREAIKDGARLEDTDEGPSDVKDVGFVITGPEGTPMAGQHVWIPASMIDKKFGGKHGSLIARLQEKKSTNYAAKEAKAIENEQKKAEAKNVPLNEDEKKLLGQKFVEAHKKRVVSGLATGGRDITELQSIIEEASVDAARATLKKVRTPEAQRKAFFTNLRGITQKKYDESFGVSRRQREAQRATGTAPVALEDITKEGKVETAPASPIKVAQAEAETLKAGEKKPPIRTKVYTEEEKAAIAKERGKGVAPSKVGPNIPANIKSVRARQAAKKAEEATKVETVASPAKDLKELKNVGRGIIEGLYDSLWVKVQKGETKENGQESAVLQLTKEVRKRGGIQTRDEFKSLASEYAKIKSTGNEYQKEMNALVEKHSPPVKAEVKPTPERKVLSRKEALPELSDVFDAIDYKKLKNKMKFPVKEHVLKPGEPAVIHSTWHDGVYRHTAMRTPDGVVQAGRGGSYDSILMEGHVAGAKKGPIPPGTTLYVIDTGPYPSQISGIDIYRALPETGALETPQVKQLPAPKAERRTKPAKAIPLSQEEKGGSAFSPGRYSIRKLPKDQGFEIDKKVGKDTIVEARFESFEDAQKYIRNRIEQDKVKNVETVKPQKETKAETNLESEGKAAVEEETEYIQQPPPPGMMSLDIKDTPISTNLLGNMKGESEIVGLMAQGTRDVLGHLNRVGQKAYDLIDVEAKWIRGGMAEIGFALKNYFSRRDVEEKKGRMEAQKILDLTHKAFGPKPSRQDLVDVMLSAESQTYMSGLSPEQNAKVAPIAAALRKYFDDSQAEFKARGLDLNFKQNQMDRLAAKLEEISNLEKQQEIARLLEEIEATDHSFVDDRVKKMSKGLEKTQEKQEKLEKALKDISETEFVHVPYRMVFQKRLNSYLKESNAQQRKKKYVQMKSLLAVKRHVNTLRELMEKKDKNGDFIIDVDDLNPVNMVMNYAYNKGQDHALLDIRDAIRQYNEIFRISSTVPKTSKDGYEWVKVSTPKLSILQSMLTKKEFKEKKAVWIRQDAFMALNDAMNTGMERTAYDRLANITKMSSFWNPAFMAMYNTIQSMRSGVLTPLHPVRSVRTFKKALKDMGGFRAIVSTQALPYSKDYLEALENGMSSTLFSNPFEHWREFADQINNKKPGNWATDAIRLLIYQYKAANPLEKATVLYPLIKSYYMAAFHFTWQMDELFRMQGYNYLREKGHSPREAAQSISQLQGDYASVPPRTRKWMNRFLFTPTFKLATMKLYGKLLKSSLQVLNQIVRHPMSYKQRTTKMQRRYFYAAMGVYLINYMFDQLMIKGLGFERDTWGRRYRKKIINENGQQDYFYMTFSSPENIIQRFTERISKAFMTPGVANPVETFIQSNKWEFLPMLRHAVSAISGQGEEGRIFSAFEDSVTTKVAKGMWYWTSKSFNFLDAIQSRTEFAANAEEREKVVNTWIKEYGEGTGRLLNAFESVFAYAYITNSDEKQLSIKLKSMKKEFVKEAFESVKKRGIVDPALIENYKRTQKEVIDKLSEGR